MERQATGRTGVVQDSGSFLESMTDTSFTSGCCSVCSSAYGSGKSGGIRHGGGSPYGMDHPIFSPAARRILLLALLANPGKTWVKAKAVKKSRYLKKQSLLMWSKCALCYKCDGCADCSALLPCRFSLGRF